VHMYFLIHTITVHCYALVLLRISYTYHIRANGSHPVHITTVLITLCGTDIVSQRPHRPKIHDTYQSWDNTLKRAL